MKTFESALQASSGRLKGAKQHLTWAGLRCSLHEGRVIGGEGYEEGSPGCFTGFTFSIEPLHRNYPLSDEPGHPQLRARVLGLGQLDTGTEIVGTNPLVVAALVAEVIRVQRAIHDELSVKV